MRKIAVHVENGNDVNECLVYLPEEFADKPENESAIRTELGKAFSGLGFAVLSVQKMVESGVEMGVTTGAIGLLPLVQALAVAA